MFALSAWICQSVKTPLCNFWNQQRPPVHLLRHWQQPVSLLLSSSECQDDLVAVRQRRLTVSCTWGRAPNTFPPRRSFPPLLIKLCSLCCEFNLLTSWWEPSISDVFESTAFLLNVCRFCPSGPECCEGWLNLWMTRKGSWEKRPFRPEQSGEWHSATRRRHRHTLVPRC